MQRRNKTRLEGKGGRGRGGRKMGGGSRLGTGSGR